MDEKIKKFFNDWRVSFVTGAILGTVFFISVYGIRVLDVTYDDFLMSYHLDATMHYLGWRLYRASSWHVMFGLCDTSLYPYLSSVVYTDSIPLFAVFFKILSPILPETFQYFGLFGLLCYILQGGLSKLLLRKYIKNELLRNVGACIFISNVVLVHRMFWQQGLAAHFLILAAFLIYAYRDRVKNEINRIVLWTILGVLSISIQFYFYGMISVMLIGFIILVCMERKQKVFENIKIWIRYLVPYLLITIALFYFLGGFYGTIKAADMYENPSGADINVLFEPMGMSSLFSGEQVHKPESFSYIGIAVACLCIPALFGFINMLKSEWKESKNKIILHIIIALSFLFFAFSPTIVFNDKQLFSIRFIPKIVLENSWGLFRNCGRFMWPIMYLIVLGAIVYSESIIKKAYPYILVLILCVQLFEFSGLYNRRHIIFSGFEARSCPADIFNDMDMGELKHIQFMQNFFWSDFYSSKECFDEVVGYTRLAMNKNMTVSNFHFARDYDKVAQEQIDKCYDDLYQGKPDKDTMYVFPKTVYMENELQGKFYNVIEYDIGADIVIFPYYE